MKKLCFWIACLLLISSVLPGCGGDVVKARKVVRISHGQPATHPDHLGLLAFKRHVEENLGDKYDIQIYPNGLLGASKEALELCQTGAIDYVVCSTSNLETFADVYQIFSVPYLFNTYEAYLTAMNDEAFMRGIYDSTEDVGFKAVTWFTAGTRSFYANKPIRTVADIRGMKIRVQPSPTNVQMMRAFDAGAVPMSFGEVYTALQQGTIDGAENNEKALIDVKHGEVAKYYSYDLHQMVPDLLVANNRFIAELPQKDRQVFAEASAIATQVEVAEWDKQTEAAKKQAAEMGVQFIEADVLSFKEKVLPMHQAVLQQNPKLRPIYEAIAGFNARAS